MTKPRTQFLNQFAQAAFDLERVRHHMCVELDDDIVLRAQATAEVEYANAVQAMSRSNGSMRSELHKLAMLAMQKADVCTSDGLTLIN